ncbi:MAG: cell division ATP-binding protein FtsE [Gammaproteobacteria bacterium]|nr:cell division ATP-binding protein FtsE [Gammaproteobacteria bacterium]
MILFRNISKRYPTAREALSEISLEIDRGELVFITGRSGAGKSTLLKLIPLIVRPSRGQLLIDNKNITNLKRRQIPWLRRNIGIIFQDHQLLHDRSVLDNVALPMVIAGNPHREIKRRTRAALDKVGLLSKENSYPIALSGGEQQRVGIARAVVHRPPILLADEPTGNLDPQLSEDIMKLLYMFHQVGVTVIIASHDIDLISRFNRRIICLDKGRLAPLEQKASADKPLRNH